MFKTITGWITWTNSVEDEWNTWIEWQRQQHPTHYEKSDIFQYYLSMRQTFRPPQNSCMNGYNSKYYIYCFGDFSSLLVNPIGNGNIIHYIHLLLDVYDICKGYLRRFKGEPACITMLRNVTLNQSLIPLKTYDFSTNAYPYISIHAHTVAQYSLSTLIMRFVAHYMSQISHKYYPNILVSSCQEAYTNYKFGKIGNIQSPLFLKEPVALTISKPNVYPININQNEKFKHTEQRDYPLRQDYSRHYTETSEKEDIIHRGGSVVHDETVADKKGIVTDNRGTVIDNRGIVVDNNGGILTHKEGIVVDNGETIIDKGGTVIDNGGTVSTSIKLPVSFTKYFRCRTCTRVTETIWGNFDTCLDCYLKRICSICGSQAAIISSDGLPKCSLHVDD